MGELKHVEMIKKVKDSENGKLKEDIKMLKKGLKWRQIENSAKEKR